MFLSGEVKEEGKALDCLSRINIIIAIIVK